MMVFSLLRPFTMCLLFLEGSVLNSSSLLKQRRQQFKKSLQTFGPSCFVRALVDVLIKNDNKIEV